MLTYGYVYLLKSGTFYKIGYSTSPRKRLRQLRTGSPFMIEVVHQIRTFFYREIEKQLHYKFAAKRGEGEWFTLTEEDVAYIKSLNASGFTPERQRQHDEEWDRQQAQWESEQLAEQARKLSVLFSGAVSGVGISEFVAEYL